MIRVGIAGMGYGAAVHLPAFLGHPGVEVAALADNGSGRAAMLCERYGLKARAFSSGDDMVRWIGVDVVSLAVPALEQSALVKKALSSGKHVLCEKPFGSGLKDIAGLDAVADREGLVGALGYEFRYDNALGSAIDRIRSGEIGTVSRINVTWLTGTGLDSSRPWSWRHDQTAAGGVLVDWCCHVIDYCHAMLGAPVSELWCSTSANIRQRPDGCGGMKAVTAPDSCDLQCFFANGAIGRVVVANVEPAGTGHTIEVFGTEGRMRFHHAPPFIAPVKQLTLQRVGEPEVAMQFANESDHRDGRFAGFRKLVGEFVTAVRGGPRSPRLPTFADGEAVWRVLTAARRSADRGRRVSVRI